MLDSDPRRTDARGAEKVEADDPEAVGDDTTGNAKPQPKEQRRKEMIQ